MPVEIQIDSLATRKSLGTLEKALGPEAMIDVLRARLLAYVDESFKTRGRGRWRPLAWGTVALRKRGGSEPLQDTGEYKKSFVSETDATTFVEVGSNIKVPGGSLSLARIHEGGTKPYIIRAKNAKVLYAGLSAGANAAGEHGPVFMTGSQRAVRGFFFGKIVHHPGVPARPVLPTTVAEAEAVLRPTVEAVLERALEKGIINGTD